MLSLLRNTNIFNFLRGTSAFFVIVWHTMWIVNMRNPEIAIKTIYCTPPWVGVWTFFIISGYLIGKGFFSERYETNSVKDFCKFYLQRAIRILPIYYLIIFIDIFFINTSMYFDLSNHILIRALTFRIAGGDCTAFMGNMWFINVVFQLYLIAPFVHLLVVKPLKKLQNAKFYVFLLILALIIFEFIMRSVNLGHHSWGRYIYCNVLFNLDVFFCGFLFNFFTQNNTFNKLKQVLMPVSLLGYIGLVIWNMIQFQKHWYIDCALDIKVYAVFLTIISVLFLIYSFDFQKEKYIKKNRLADLFNPIRWFEHIGIFSMGFFISHCQTIENLTHIIHFKNDIVYTSNLLGILHHPLRITISANCLTLNVVLFFTILFSLSWGVIIYNMLEKPLNRFRYSLKGSSK